MFLALPCKESASIFGPDIDPRLLNCRTKVVKLGLSKIFSLSSLDLSLFLIRLPFENLWFSIGFSKYLKRQATASRIVIKIDIKMLIQHPENDDLTMTSCWPSGDMRAIDHVLLVAVTNRN